MTMSHSANAAFALAPPPTPASKPPRLVWHLATNQLNLMYLLATGLVTGPRGLGRKYHRDALSLCPGWLPLFAESIPGAVLDLAASEGGHLRRVVAALDLARLKGQVHALGSDRELRTLAFPEGLTGEEQVLLVPAPLPATWIQTILFASKEDAAATLDEAADYRNVPLDAYKRQVRPKLFNRMLNVAWPPKSGALPERDAPTQDVAAIGGALGLHFALGNRDDSLVEAGRLLWGPPTDGAGEAQPEAPADPLLAALIRWASLAGPMDGQDIQGGLLLDVLQGVVDARARWNDPPQTDGQTVNPRQAVLDVLELQRQRLPKDKWQAALERLASDLQGILGLGGDTVSELLNRHTKPFSRGLILFFLREDCEDLVELRQPLLTGMDYVIAAALFGARSGWMGLPAEVRAQPRLREAVTHRMAALAQRHQQSGVDLGPAPERVRPLRELLGPRGNPWGKTQQAGALTLARGMGWSQVMQTRISLGKGDYRLQVDGRGVHILLDGEVKAVSTEIDRDGFFARLAESAISVRLDAEVRADLGS
jgi:hypothetical protein